MITFYKTFISGQEEKNISEVISKNDFSDRSFFSDKCSEWLVKETHSKRALLTGSCTQALEMSAVLADIKPGDEVIMPSFTFVSTANAFVLAGAKIIFVDIRPDTLNINESLIERAITKKTKAIVVMHYAGLACEMDVICSIAKKHHLLVIEDAALGLGAAYKKQALGSIGNFGCYSFHYTKSVHCLQGGAIMINRASDIDRAETVREKGTNRIQFLKGEVNKYTWIDKGSNYILSELSAAFLYAQLEQSEKVIKKRKTIWSEYYSQLKQLQKAGRIELPVIPDYCTHNASVFYIKVKNQIVRNKLIDHLKKKKIQTAFHYVPLHSSFAGLKFGKFHGEDKYTTKESSRLLRLPLFFDLSNDQVSYICESISAFYK